MPRLQRADAFLIVIDVQLKLMPVISEREAVESFTDFRGFEL